MSEYVFLDPMGILRVNKPANSSAEDVKQARIILDRLIVTVRSSGKPLLLYSEFNGSDNLDLASRKLGLYIFKISFDKMAMVVKSGVLLYLLKMLGGLAGNDKLRFFKTEREAVKYLLG